MKQKYVFTSIVAVVLLVWGTLPIFAQDDSDTLTIPWETTTGSEEAEVNILRTTIANDTLRPDGRVYKLERGGFYWITDPVESAEGFPIIIVGETASDLEEGETDYGPAVIQRVAYDDGTAPSGYMFNCYDDLTVKNAWLMGMSNQGELANYEPIKLMGTGKQYVFDNVIFDRNDWHHLGLDGTECKVYITNCKFRNIFGPTQIWEGLGIRVESGADTVVIENNTFFNIGFTPFQSEAAPVDYLRINHNTMVNIGRAFQAGSIWMSAYVTNNLFVNCYWAGDSYDQYSDPDMEDPYTGFFSIDDLPAAYGTNLERKILLANNSYWRDSDFDTWYTEGRDTVIRAQPFVNDTTTKYFDDYDNMLMESNYSQDPSLTTYITDDIFDEMTDIMDSLYAGYTINNRDNLYYWDPDRPDNYVNINWPLPEDFSYSNTDLQTAGTDGLPLGDLNWFPSSLTNFENNKDEYIAAIEAKVTAPDLEIVATLEAEDATLSGDATVETPEGFIYFYMESSGYIQWDFEMESAQDVDLVLYTYLNGNSSRGQRIIVNSNSTLRNDEGYGEYFWSTDLGDPSDEWFYSTIAKADLIEGTGDYLSLPAGANTIRIEPSWGYQSFGGIDIYEAGTTTLIMSLASTDASYENVTANADDVPWVPNNFKSVNLGAGGSITWSYDAESSGNYMLRVFFATDNSVSTQVDVNSTTVTSSLVLADTSDEMTGVFAMNSGSNSITLSSTQGGVNVDYIQIIKYSSTGIGDDEAIDKGFALSQNYPNPFNPTTNINFKIGKQSNVKLTVYNILGQRVATLINKEMSAGAYTFKFNAGHLASGVYIYRLETADFRVAKKMMLLK